MRERRYLTEPEVLQLIAAARRGRYPDRDSLLIELMYRHGLRASEAVGLRWSDIDWRRDRILIRRKKNGRTGTHPLSNSEQARLQTLRDANDAPEYVFAGERGPMHRQNVNRIVAEAAKTAELPVRVTPHSLRHACGFELADRKVDVRRIQQYLGHRSVSSTILYTDLAGRALDDIWG